MSQVPLKCYFPSPYKMRGNRGTIPNVSTPVTGASSSPNLITFGRVAVLVVSEPPPQFRHKIYFVLRGKRQRKTLCQCVISFSPQGPSSQYRQKGGSQKGLHSAVPEEAESQSLCVPAHVCLILPSRLLPSARPNMPTKGWNPAAPGRIRMPKTGPRPMHELTQATSMFSAQHTQPSHACLN